jgi:hypothetical protein
MGRAKNIAVGQFNSRALDGPNNQNQTAPFKGAFSLKALLTKPSTPREYLVSCINS